MADTTHAPQAGHGNPEYSRVVDRAAARHATETGHIPGYSPEMDGPAHEATYDGFVHFTTVGCLFVIGCVVGLAVGGIKHEWLWAIFGIVVVHIAAAIGLFAPGLKWKPGAAAVGLLLFMLVFF